MKERGEKGHFVKGNEIGKETRFTRTGETGRTQREREIQRMGGLASKEKKMQRQTYAEIAAIIGGMPASENDRRNLEKLGMTPEFIEQATQDAIIVAAQIAQAKGGNTNAAKWLRDTKGESVQNINLQGTLNTQLRFEDIMPKDE